MYPERSDIVLGAFGFEESLTCGGTEFDQILGAEVGQFMLFDVAPQIFYWVEVRCVGGQLLGDDFAAVFCP